MNLNIEACRICPVQCQLEKRSQKIIDFYETENSSLDSIRTMISKMLQEAGQLPCPTTEIQRVTRLTRAKVDPSRVGRTRFVIAPSEIAFSYSNEINDMQRQKLDRYKIK